MTAVMVVVPTTAGPLAIRSLKTRSGLPASAAFADGDYRPLPWSADYARLAAPGGPLAMLLGGVPAPHELRLTGSFDAGRSWEAPVCLAHALAARDWALTADPAAAGLILWATGAVDLDLGLIPGDYALLDKLARSRPLFEAAPEAELAVLLPDGPERDEAVLVLGALARARPPTVLSGATIRESLAALDASASAVTGGAPAALQTRRFGGRAALAVGLGGVAALSGASLIAAATWRSLPVEQQPVPTPAVLVAAVSDKSPVLPRPAVVPEAPILIDELRASSGSSCRRVVFGADLPERRPVLVEASDRLQPSRLDDAFCGVAVKARLPGARLTVGPELRAASLAPVVLGDGAEAYYLRADGRRERVYAVQVESSAGRGHVSHALVP